MKTVQTVEEIAAILNGRPGHVAVDGATGVGKSRLTAEAARRIGAKWIQLDAFIPKTRTSEDGRSYVERLDLQGIRNAIAEALAADRRLLLDGICVRDVLKLIPLSVGTHVYVKAINSHSFWGDEVMCDVGRIKEAEELGIVDETLGRLDTEIRAYHRMHNPAGTADVIYLRTRD